MSDLSETLPLLALLVTIGAAGFGVLIAVPSVVMFLFVDPPPHDLPPYTIGTVNQIAFAIVVAMPLLTTPLGVRLALKANPGPFKRFFAIFLH